MEKKVTMKKLITKHWFFYTNNKILVKWIISGCFILFIPMACIIFNFFYTKDMFTKNINETNRITLLSTRYNIDNRLQSLLDLSTYIMVNEDFSNRALKTTSQNEFINQMVKSMKALDNYKQINPAIDILIYLPNRDYIVTPNTANLTKNIYDSIKSNAATKPTLSYNEWITLLQSHSKNQFFIDSKYSYQNYGNDSIIFSTNSTFIYEPINNFTIYASIPFSFIDELLSDNQKSTVCIINKDGTILKKLGSTTYNQDSISDIPVTITSEYDITSFKLDKTNYVASYVKSEIYDWYYAIYTPTSLHLKSSIHLRNVSMLTIGLSLLFGISSIVFLQFRNYRPISKLVDRVPSEIKSSGNNEFILIETYYQALHKENEIMKTTIQSQHSYAKEVFLLSKLKGRKFYLSDSDMGEYLNWELENKQFAIASISLNIDDKEMTAQHFDLLSFSINNVLSELLNHEYVFETVIDEISMVYIFTFDDSVDSLAKWDMVCKEKLQQLYEFFRDNFHIDLSIIVGDVFRNFENATDYYNEILDVFTYGYVVEQYGVISTQALEMMNLSHVETLQKYRKEVIRCVTKKDITGTKLLMGQLYETILSEEEPFIMVKYYLLSMISELLFVLRNKSDDSMLKSILSNDKNSSQSINQYLMQLTNSTTIQQTFDEFTNVMMYLCSDITILEDGTNISPEEDSFIKEIKDYVNDHYDDINMNISGISEAIGLSPKYMSKLFKEKTNEGLLVFISRIRISHAKALLQETNLTIDEISIKTGFTNTKSFRRNFLKIVGMNPTDFRK